MTYAIINIRQSYDGKTSKSWLTNNYNGKAQLFETKTKAKAELENVDGGTTMHLSHNEYSNRYHVRRLTSVQLTRLTTRGH